LIRIRPTLNRLIQVNATRLPAAGFSTDTGLQTRTWPVLKPLCDYLDGHHLRYLTIRRSLAHTAQEIAPAGYAD